MLPLLGERAGVRGPIEGLWPAISTEVQGKGGNSTYPLFEAQPGVDPLPYQAVLRGGL